MRKSVDLWIPSREIPDWKRVHTLLRPGRNFVKGIEMNVK